MILCQIRSANVPPSKYTGVQYTRTCPFGPRTFVKKKKKNNCFGYMLKLDALQCSPFLPEISVQGMALLKHMVARRASFCPKDKGS